MPFPPELIDVPSGASFSLRVRARISFVSLCGFVRRFGYVVGHAVRIMHGGVLSASRRTIVHLSREFRSSALRGVSGVSEESTDSMLSDSA
jgi:hypothetical protein